MMKFFVKIKAFDSVHGEIASKLWGPIGKSIQKVASSGKMLDGAIFADQRGGYFVLELKEAHEIHDLLAPTIMDNFSVECHPLMSFDELGKIFQKMMAERKGS
jgi:hypothetical protein